MASEDAALREEAEPVRVGVVLVTSPEHEERVVICEGGRGVDYRAAEDEAIKESFSFDQVVAVEDVESFHRGLLQPLAESTSSGYSGALLISGASTETVKSVIDQRVVPQFLANLLGCAASRDPFISVSSLQFYPDGSAVDLLNLNKQTPRLVTHPVLGSFIEGLSEVCVHSPEEAFSVYETCSKRMKANGGAIFSRCSSLFTVRLEWKLHPVESDVCRGRLQLFGLAGGATRTDLRGVSPLLKVVDQIPRPAGTTRNSGLLHSLLNEALTGNGRTVLISCVNTQAVLHEQAHAALALAQRVRTMVTTAAVARWSPRSAEQDIRHRITELRGVIMSQGQSGGQSISELAELTRNLQIVKDQSWAKRREESEKMKVKLESCKSSNINQQLPGGQPADHRGSPEIIQQLQERLKQEMEEHIREGKGCVDVVQERVVRIQQLKDALRDETRKNQTAKRPISQQSQLEFNDAQERRRQLKDDHGRLIQEEVEKMKRDLAQDELPAEGPQRELLVLTRERQILVLQVEALRAEARQAERDVQEQKRTHQAELHCLREESLQVFRVFRHVTEEQRKLSEDRHRAVLLEAVQDAIYLSAQNQQLQADKKQLCKALGELKDALAVRGDPTAGLKP